MTTTGELPVMRLPVLDDLDGHVLRIDQADQHILFSTELLDEIKSDPSPHVTVADGVLRIVGINRTVAYRLGEPGRYGVPAERIDE